MLAAWQSDQLRTVIDETLTALRPFGQLPAWTMNNHDTQRSANRFGRSDAVEAGGFHEGQFRISTAPIDPEIGQQRARAAAMLTLALPGCVYLYAGEELGLPEVLDIPADRREDPVFHQGDGTALGRDGCRVPLPWTISDTRSYGFSLSVSERGGQGRPGDEDPRPSWLPQPADWGQWSVESQHTVPSSTLALYQLAGRIRRNLEGLQGTEFAWIDGVSEQLLAFERGDVLVICNPTRFALPLPIDLIGPRKVVLNSATDTLLNGNANLDNNPDEGGSAHPITISPDTTIWFA
jgi:alpha-glucosidase